MSPLVIEVPTASAPLPAELFRTGTSTAVTVVFAHGAGAGHQSPFMRRMASLLATHGLAVLTFDFPYVAAGRKLPDRPPLLEAAFRDAVDAAVAVTTPRAIVLAGKSLGGRMATHLAADPAAWRAAVPLAGAVAFGYPLRPPGPRGGDRVSHLRRLAVPTLIVQGTRDTFGGPEAIAADVGPVAHLTVHPIETGDHSLKVLASSGRRPADVEADIARHVATWIATLPTAL